MKCEVYSVKEIITGIEVIKGRLAIFIVQGQQSYQEFLENFLSGTK